MEKSQFQDILHKISSGSLIESFDKGTKENFKAVVRVKSSDIEGESHSEKCDKWIRDFEKNTHTGYIVKDSHPNPQRYLYRKEYVCQHNQKNKSNTSGNVRQRNLNCNASNIIIKILKCTNNTLRKDKLLRRQYDMQIQINYYHNHRTQVSSTLGFLRVSKETAECYESYFEDGLSPSAARDFHQLRLKSQCEFDEKKFQRVGANTRLNPLLRTVIHLHDTWNISHHGGRQQTTVFQVIEKRKAEFEKNGTKIITKEEPFIVAVATPIMQRAHKQRFSGETCFVDSTGSCDQTGSVATFLFGSTKTGGVPLAAVFHTQQSEENYTEAFSCVRELLGEDGFNSQASPKIFMTDDSSAERNALKKVFPSAELLLCIFHVVQALWRWLWDPKHKIIKEHRKYLCNLFRDLLYADTEICFDELVVKFTNDPTVKKYQNYTNYVNDYLLRKKEWALCFRIELLTRGNNTNNYVESSIRIFKDLVLKRCKAYNVTALLRYVVQDLEKYHEIRLQNFANGNVSSYDVSYKKLLKKSSNLKVIKKDSTTFHVSSALDEQFLYTVNTILEVCDCIIGQNGKFCKHLLAVAELHKVKFMYHPKIMFHDRVSLAQLAYGENVDPEFYRSMNYSDDSEDLNTTDVINSNNLMEDCFTQNAEQNEMNCLDNNTDSDNIQQGDNNSDSDNIQQDNENINNNSCIEEIDIFKTNCDRIASMLLSSPSPYLLAKLKKLNSNLKNTETTGSFLNLIQNGNFNITASRKKYISVQPASTARRKTRPEFKAGKKRLQSGRPATQERGGESSSKKRKRNLGQNISLNVPNAKTL